MAYNYGIDIYDCDNVSVTANTVKMADYASDRGIYYHAVTNSVIADNVIASCTISMYGSFGSDNNENLSIYNNKDTSSIYPDNTNQLSHEMPNAY